MRTPHKALCLLLLFCGGVTSSLHAQQPKKIKSKLEKATVFFEGAELTHIAKVTLEQGDNEILIEELSPNIDRNSIKVKTADGVMVSSYEFSIDYLSSEKEILPLIKVLNDSIEFYKVELEYVEIDYRINTSLMKQLAEGINKNVSGSEEGLGIDDLIKAIDYLKTKSLEFEKENLHLKYKREELQKNITRLETELAKEKQKNQSKVRYTPVESESYQNRKYRSFYQLFHQFS